MDLCRTKSGVKPLTGDTFPLEGIGGVRGTGTSQPFFQGGYCSSGCAGALPLCRHELKTGTSLESSQFFASLSASLLEAMQPAKDSQLEEPSPKSVCGYDFGEEVEQEAELRMDHTAWQEVCATD